MSRLVPPAPITAIFYTDGRAIDRVLARIAAHLAAQGLACAGFIQREEPRPGRSRCDMILEDLASGVRVGISQDRGEGARGCRLDASELLRAMGLARQSLERAPDLVVVNKFGRAEGDGGGFRPLIAEAVERQIPVLVAVPVKNTESWRTFAGALSQEHHAADLPDDDDALCRSLGLVPEPALAADRP